MAYFSCVSKGCFTYVYPLTVIVVVVMYVSLSSPSYLPWVEVGQIMNVDFFVVNSNHSHIFCCVRQLPSLHSVCWLGTSVFHNCDVKSLWLFNSSVLVLSHPEYLIFFLLLLWRDKCGVLYLNFTLDRSTCVK